MNEKNRADAGSAAPTMKSSGRLRWKSRFNAFNGQKIMKSIIVLSLISAMIPAFSGCGSKSDPSGEPVDLQSQAEKEIQSSDEISANDEADASEKKANEKETEEADVLTLKMTINGKEIPMIWENNESVDALKSLASLSPITIEMSAYGGFEQVGSIGSSLPENDELLTTEPGDVVLYSGNRIVVFFGSNTWEYTRLGRIDGLSASKLKELLSEDAVELSLFAG